jgi:hypothetical protein
MMHVSVLHSYRWFILTAHYTITQVNVQELGGGYTWLQRYGDAAAVVITRGRLWGACWATGGGAVDLVTRVAFAV